MLNIISLPQQVNYVSAEKSFLATVLSVLELANHEETLSNKD